MVGTWSDDPVAGTCAAYRATVVSHNAPYDRACQTANVRDDFARVFHLDPVASEPCTEPVDDIQHVFRIGLGSAARHHVIKLIGAIADPGFTLADNLRAAHLDVGRSASHCSISDLVLVVVLVGPARLEELLLLLDCQHHARMQQAGRGPAPPWLPSCFTARSVRTTERWVSNACFCCVPRGALCL